MNICLRKMNLWADSISSQELVSSIKSMSCVIFWPALNLIHFVTFPVIKGLSLKTSYHSYQGKLGQTGHGLLTEDREAEIVSGT